MASLGAVDGPQDPAQREEEQEAEGSPFFMVEGETHSSSEQHQWQPPANAAQDQIHQKRPAALGRKGAWIVL